MLITVSVAVGGGGIRFITISITDNCYSQNHTSATCQPERGITRQLKANSCPEPAFHLKPMIKQLCL